MSAYNKKSKRCRWSRLWTTFSLLTVVWSTTRLLLTIRSLQGGEGGASTTVATPPTLNPQRDGTCPPNIKQDYQGILWIQQGDREGAAGTIFYLFVLNQLLYAERHHLYPWIHLSNASQWIYDPAVHGNNNNNNNTKLMVTAPDWDPTLPAGLVEDCPAPPPLQDASQFRIQRLPYTGNGVWASYFQPRDVPACVRALPVVTLTPDQILHGLHVRCPWSVRAWRYGGTPTAIKASASSYHEWWEPQRRVAAGVVARYYQWQPALRAAVDAVTPSTQPCLGVHIRHSDKANQRQRLSVNDFVPYLTAYWARIPHGAVYVATDSHAVVDELKHFAVREHKLPQMHTQPHVLRSSNTSAVFRLTENHDETNRQVLIDIGALSRCTFLLHGLSAVSEAAIYHNFALHERSLNLEDTRHPPTVQDWERILQEYFMSDTK